jgi:hypothetical protein
VIFLASYTRSPTSCLLPSSKYSGLASSYVRLSLSNPGPRTNRASKGETIGARNLPSSISLFIHFNGMITGISIHLRSVTFCSYPLLGELLEPTKPTQLPSWISRGKSDRIRGFSVVRGGDRFHKAAEQGRVIYAVQKVRGTNH